MTARGAGLVLACVALIAVGQLLFKTAAGQWRVDAGPWVALRTLASPAFIAALVIYGVATLLWVFALRTVPLATAFPLYALTFLLVPALEHFVFGAPLPPNALVGGAVIIAGVAIIAR